MSGLFGRIVKSRFNLVLLVVGGIGGIVFWGGFNTFMEYTNTLNFCVSCHEMGTVYTEYKEKPHAVNPSGVPAVCSDCHVPKSWGPKLWRKIKASNELLHKALGTIDTPEKFEAKRLTLARSVWASMEASDSRECRNCHDPKTMMLKGQSDQANKWHERELLTGKQTCIHCHKGIAHKLPNLVKHYEGKLKAVKSQNTIKTGAVATIVGKAALHGEAKADSAALANLDMGTDVDILETGAEMVKVRFTGWDREMSMNLHEAAGRPIRAAKLTGGGMDKMKIGKTVKDNHTQLDWREITLEGWVDKTALTTDTQGLWDYAEIMFKDDCGLCHIIPPVDLWQVNEWPFRIKRMRRYTQLDMDQMALVSRFLQRGTFEAKKRAKKRVKK